MADFIEPEQSREIVYETDPLICPNCQGEMWFDKLTTLRKPEGRIISFIDQPDLIQKILQHLGLWEESYAPPDRDTQRKGLTFDPSYSLSQRLIRLRWRLV